MTPLLPVPIALFLLFQLERVCRISRLTKPMRPLRRRDSFRLSWSFKRSSPLAVTFTYNCPGCTSSLISREIDRIAAQVEFHYAPLITTSRILSFLLSCFLPFSGFGTGAIRTPSAYHAILLCGSTISSSEITFPGNIWSYSCATGSPGRVQIKFSWPSSPLKPKYKSHDNSFKEQDWKSASART